VLLPHLAAVTVDRAEVGGDLVRAWVRARAEGAACPRCGTWCTKVKGSYTRTLHDGGIGGRRVVIRLLVRLLACGNAGCAVKTFAEQPEGLASRYARATPLLRGQLTAVARALAGRAGSRLAAVLAVEVSRHTLVRLLMALPDPPAALVRVLGVDDFSLRRGHSYATILVDMETGRPVDVLPDREAATLAAWLREHPGAEVICRDRGGAYAEGARDGAPDAVQVADRWHIYHNLCEHARNAVARHRDCLKDPGRACRHQDPDPDAGQEKDQERDQPEQEERDQPEQEERAAGLEAVIRARHAEVHELRAAGRTLAQAAAALGLTRQVTGRFWRAGSAADLLAVRGTSGLDPWKPYLRQRWDQGATQISALWREITAMGYQGSYRTAYAWLALLRLAAPPRPPAPPTIRQATRLITTDPATLSQARQAQLAAICGHCPELAALAGYVAGFAEILTGHHGARGAGLLDHWMAAVDADTAQRDLHSFTHGIGQDHQAVRNAMTLPWSSGPVEGLNTRTKLIKRQMYGRARFPLLRKRILITS
jgi:transposase